MSLFRPRATLLGRVLFGATLATPVAVVVFMLIYARTPFYTNQAFPVIQPVQFDHRHHVADDGIDCRFCHDAVTVSATAGIPPTERCMGCHSQVWNKSALLEPVRLSFFQDTSIEWKRVHHLPNFVYFNHSIHVGKAVGCVSCHGRVDQLPLIQQMAPLNMGWCLRCHRDPNPNLRPIDQITSTTWEPPPEDPRFQQELASRYQIHTRTDCITCHR
jgi:hypothetical protein